MPDAQKPARPALPGLMRRWAKMAALAQLVVSFGASAQAWTFREIPLLPGSAGVSEQSRATGINNAGDVVGWVQNANLAAQLVVWRGGQVITLPLPAGSRLPLGTVDQRINDGGQVIANVIPNTSNTGLPVRWDGLHPSILPSNGLGSANSINSAGLVAGNSVLPDNLNSAATIWTGNVPFRIDSSPSSARAINDAGTVVGNLLPTTNLPRFMPVIWRNGTRSQLEELPGATSTSPAWISQTGAIAGNAIFGGTQRAVRWDDAGRVSELNAPPGSSAAFAINSAGDVVGHVSSPISQFLPVIWRAGVPIDLFAATGAALQGWNFGMATGINERGQIVGFGRRGDGAIRAFLVSPFELVDIVSFDGRPLLLNGAQITNNVESLATGGRAIQGVAADGATITVLRFQADRVGDVFTIDLAPNQCATAGSKCVDSYGRLFAVPGTLTPALYDNAGSPGPLQVIAQSTSLGPMAFVGYRSPSDFVRVDSEVNGNADKTAATRQVRIQISSQTQQEVSIRIARPPVIVVHGLWANSRELGDLQKLGSEFGQLFKTSFATYGDERYYTYGGGSATRSSVITEITGASLGFSHGAAALLKSMMLGHGEIRSGANSAGVPIASTQYDVVGHSMGNLVTRTMVTAIARAGGPISAPTVLRDRSYVHKLISIGGPHLGSPLARELAAESNACIRNILALDGKYSFGDCPSCVSAFRNRSVVQDGFILRDLAFVGPGAIGDLSGSSDAAALSAALTELRDRGKRIPTAYVAGVISNLQLDAALGPTPTNRYCTQALGYELCVNLGAGLNLVQILRNACSGPLVDKIATPETFRLLMTGRSDRQADGRTDGVVSLQSQLNDPALRPNYPVVPVVGLFHSPGAALLFKRFGVDEPTELTPSPVASVLEGVRTLLNIPVTNVTVFVP